MQSLRRLFLLVLLAVTLPVRAVNFDSLQAMVERSGLRSIEAVLSALPGWFRSRYALMFRSRSVQQSSFEDPRAILYAPDARFVVSFNGDPGQAGYDALETMEYEPSRGLFVFREIRFPSAGDADGRVEFSPPNPPRCLRCHGDPAHPIWDTHPSWPGAYGERYRAALSRAEMDGLERFLRNQPTHPRYRHLIDAARLKDRDTFRQSASSQYDGPRREAPNAELSRLFSRMNVDAIVHDIASDARFADWKYALLAAAGHECGLPESFLPAPVRATFRQGLARFGAETDAINARQAQLKRLRMFAGQRSAGGAYAIASGEPLTAFRYLVETALQRPTGRWTLALEKPTYDFSAPDDTAALWRSALFAAAARDDPELRAVAEIRTFGRDDRYCEYITRHGADASRRITWTADRPRERSYPAEAGGAAGTGDDPAATAHTTAPTALCATCHAEGVGPSLPFRNPEALATALVGGHYPHGTLLDEIRFRLSAEAGAARMPVGTILSASERTRLESYLEDLSRTAASDRR